MNTQAGEECALERQRRRISDANNAIDFMKHLGGNELFFNPYKESVIRLEGFVSGNISYESAVEYHNHQQDIKKQNKNRAKLVTPKDAEIAELKRKVEMYESATVNKQN